MPLTLIAKQKDEQQFNWRVFRMTLPIFLGLILLSLVPGWSRLGFCPNFLSIILYLWFLYRPDLISNRLIVVIGIFRDSLFSYPLGISVIELLLLQLFTQILRRFIIGHSYWVTYLGFAIFSLSSQTLLWLLLSCTRGVLLPFNGAAKAIIFNILIFPLFSQLSIQLQRYIDQRQQRGIG